MIQFHEISRNSVEHSKNPLLGTYYFSIAPQVQRPKQLIKEPHGVFNLDSDIVQILSMLLISHGVLLRFE